MSVINFAGAATLKLEAPEYDPMKHLAIMNPRELRGFCLKSSIETQARVYDFDREKPAGEAVTNDIITRAKAFEDYISGGNE